jgi:long-chain acyl-CoA synthetase
MNTALLLQRTARLHPTLTATALGGRPVRTYAALLAEVRALAGGLARAGLRPGDRVALFMANRPVYVELLLAIWWQGLAAVPINAKLHRREAAEILADSGARLLFCCARTRADVAGLETGIDGLEQVIEAGTPGFERLRAGEPAAEAPAEAGDDDLAWLFYTSGTTGRPKGAMTTHRNLIHMVQGYLTDIDAITPGAALIHAAPLSHGSGLYLLPFLAQGGVQVLPPSTGFEPGEFFEIAAAWPEASVFAAPTMVARLTAAAAKLRPPGATLRTIVYGGGPMFFDDLQAAIRVFGPIFAQLYGQGEAPMTITAMSRTLFRRAVEAGDEAYLRTVGAPHLGTELRIRREDGSEAAVGEIGEITVKSPTVMAGYWNHPEASANTIVDGWLLTGDLGKVDARGLLKLEGRSKETIISGGSNIYPIEVENLLMSHPQVLEAAVVGLPDPEWGEVVAAFVVPAPGAVDLAALLDRHCLAGIARFKRPKIYHFRDSLPKNAYGKILKRVLVEALGRDAGAGKDRRKPEEEIL